MRPAAQSAVVDALVFEQDLGLFQGAEAFAGISACLSYDQANGRLGGRIAVGPHFGKSYAVNLNHAHEELQDLVERVTIELELMNVANELDA